MLGLPARQNKVGAYGTAGKGQKQPNTVVRRGQDHPGVAELGQGGVADTTWPISGAGRVATRPGAAKAGQDAGSIQGSSKIALSTTERVNKGAPETEGHTPIGGELRAGTKFSDVGVNRGGKADPGSTGSSDSTEGLPAFPWLMD